MRPVLKIALATVAYGLVHSLLASRHPLNFYAVPLFWLTRKLSSGRLAFNVVATRYLTVGSLHEKRRLQSVYGRSYAEYLQTGVPFFVPLPRALQRLG